MNNNQFSDMFDTIVASYKRFKSFDDKEILDSIEFDEYEKSLYLTQAQEEIVINLYSGRNSYENSFENTEELRRYLDSLIKTRTYEVADAIGVVDAISENSLFFKLPEDLSFITYEQVIFNDASLGCYNGQVADVYPVTQDEYNRIIKNPFRGPTKRRVLRIDTGDNSVELVSKYNIDKYLIKYLAKPSPIILVDLPNALEINGVSMETPCKLNEALHNTILKKAVQLALTSKSINIKDKSE